jgi:hypothetical protein
MVRPYGRRWRASPSCLEVPDTPGTVDALSLGVTKVAVLKDEPVVRQGRSPGRMSELMTADPPGAA